MSEDWRPEGEPILTMPLAEEFDEEQWNDGPVGPSSDSACKVTRGNVCGSGSIVGERDGKTLVLTNAHVAGTRPGTRVTCYFWKTKQSVGGRIVMAAYSDKIMMDWAVLELDEKVDLPIVKLSKEPLPSKKLYTAGWPRCKGPYFSSLSVQGTTHGGTVVRWQPNSIGGQSGSGVHAPEDDLQYCLLTWSWGGDGAGQSCRAIWFQYVTRAAYGLERPEGLIELGGSQPDLENGIFVESNITTLPIWAHLDEPAPPDPDKPDPEPPSNDFVAAVLKKAQAARDEMLDLIELARSAGAGGGSNGEGEGDDEGEDEPPMFGLPLL